MTSERWPIDTAAGRVVMGVGLLFLFSGGVAIKFDGPGWGPWWGYALIGLAIALAGGFRALFFRGYFGKRNGDDEELL